MGRRLRARLGSVVVLAAASAWLGIAAAPAASAHPLGNFTVNYFSEIRVEPHALVLDLVVDQAEIPTLQAFPQASVGQQPAGADDWKRQECATLAARAQLTVAGRQQTLTVTSTRLQLLAGAAGLATSRLECTARTSAPLDTVGHAVSYQAAPTGGRVGWHEITARGDGVRLSHSTVPEVSTSKRLTAYPKDLLASPLDQRTAEFSVDAGSGRVSGERQHQLLVASPLYGLDRITSAYTDLVSRTSMTPGFIVIALLLSVVLGGLHAFAPGHGKTLMAAYLVGRQGTWRQAAVIGVSVTITHTIGVLLLGVALSVAAIAAPEAVYPWLGLVSGVLLAGIGVTLLRGATNTGVQGSGQVHTHGGRAHTHSPSGHSHSPGELTHSPRELSHSVSGLTHTPTELTHAPSGHPHGPSEITHTPSGHTHGAPHKHQRIISTGRLAAVGLVGGMVPSPSALLVLLGGIALGRAWFGAVLVLAYGAGMAAALVGTGLLLVLARDRFERWSAGRNEHQLFPGQQAALRWTRRLPILTASSVILVGIWIIVRSAGAL